MQDNFSVNIKDLLALTLVGPTQENPLGVQNLDNWWCIFAQRFSFFAKIVSKNIVLPKEMLDSFSIETFLTNYDVTNRKL